MGALVRRAEELPGGRVRIDYVKTGADDYAHAEVYNFAAVELMWRKVGLRVIEERLATPVALLPAGDDEDGIDPMTGVPIYRGGFESFG